MWYKDSGISVKKGDLLGVINDPDGRASIEVYAERDGHIFGHNNAPVVSQGDALFHIGYEAEEIIHRSSFA